jgi:hypothetical protein
MKLSEAIELAITSGRYPKKSQYMCFILEDLEQKEHKASVQEMVHKINPYYITLRGALLSTQQVTVDMDITKYMLDLYCWWVFDLKRKGL